MWDSAIFYAIAKCVIRKRITAWKTSRRTKAIGMLETVSLSIQKVRLFYNFISRVFPRWGPWCASESPGLWKCTSSGPIKMCGIRTLKAEHFNKLLICRRQTKDLETDLGWWWGVEFFTEVPQWPSEGRDSSRFLQMRKDVLCQLLRIQSGIKLIRSL